MLSLKLIFCGLISNAVIVVLVFFVKASRALSTFKGESGSWDDYLVNNSSVIIDTADSFFRMWYSGRQNPNYYPPFFIGYATALIITFLEDNKNLLIPSVYILSQNYPNPFNPSTTIEFTLPKSEFVVLKVFNILGKEVSILIHKRLNQGNHTYTFDGTNLASGVYYNQMVTGEHREVKKMILLR